MKCSDEISIGEYVRNRYGYIGKYTKNSNGIYEIKIRNGLVCRINSKEEIVKHSKDIIDLVQQGDYVNGYMVLDKFTDPFIKAKKIRVDFINRNWQGDCSDETYSNDEIKSIITKEQIKQIEFRIKEWVWN